MIEYRYVVRYGYDQLSKVSITAGPELEKAIYAKMHGRTVELSGRIFDGKHIIDIRPDYHYYTGWYPHYQPQTGDDWQQIERDCPAQLDGLLAQYTERVRKLIQSNNTHQIGRGTPIAPSASLRNSGSVYAKKLLAQKTKA